MGSRQTTFGGGPQWPLDAYPGVDGGPGLDDRNDRRQKRYTHLPVIAYVGTSGLATEVGCKKIRNPTMEDGAIHVEPLVGPGMGFNDQFPYLR